MSASSSKSAVDVYGNGNESYSMTPLNLPQQTKKVSESTTKRRWLVIIVYFTISALNSWHMMTFVPIAYEAHIEFGINNEQVNWLSLIFVAVSLPGGFVAAYILEHFGLAATFNIIATLQMIGSWTRMLVFVVNGANAKFAILILGNLICALGEPLTAWSPSKIAFTWFSSRERALADSVCSLALPWGMMFGAVIGSVWVHGNESMIFMYLMFLATLATAGCLMTIATMWYTKGTPKTAPSITAATSTNMRKNEGVPSFLSVIKTLQFEYQYWLLCFVVGGTIGCFHVFVLLAPQLFCPYGYKAIYTSTIIIASVVLAGLLGALIFGVILGGSTAHVLLFKILYMLGSIGFILICTINFLLVDNLLLLLIALLYGFLALPLYPLGNELGAEMLYPTSPTYSAGLIYTSGGIIATVFGSIVNMLSRRVDVTNYPRSECYLKTGETKIVDYKYGLVFLGAMTIPFALASLFFKSQLKRSQLEDFNRIVSDEGDSEEDSIIKSATPHYFLSPRINDEV